MNFGEISMNSHHILERDARPFFEVGQKVRLIIGNKEIAVIEAIRHQPNAERPRFHQAYIRGPEIEPGYWDTFWMDLEKDRCDCDPEKVFEPHCLDCVLKRFP